MASQRNRITRGPNRNSGGLGASGAQGQGEEYQLWQRTKETLQAYVEKQNAESALVQQIIEQDAYMTQHAAGAGATAGATATATMDAETEEHKQEDLFRKGVRKSEALSEQLKNLVQNLEVIRAIQKSKEEEAEARGGSGSGGALLGGTPARAAALASGSTRSAGRAGTREREREREREKERGRERERERREREQREQREQREASERAADRDKDPYAFEGPGDEMDVEPAAVAAAATTMTAVPTTTTSTTTTTTTGRKGGHRGNSVAAAGERAGSRDSMPPRGSDRGDRAASAKADSAEPPGSGSGNGNGNGSGGSNGIGSGSGSSAAATAAQRSRVMFVKGQDVVFKPKQAPPGEPSEWFLGRVQQVLGEGKSRRYKVKDEDPDVPPEQRQEYRTSASSMIPLPARGNRELADLERGRWVLALYPDSTTFYKAEVMSTNMDKGKVHLRFEGEENSGTLQEVERRFVVEFRN